jgi:hypothetical protein
MSCSRRSASRFPAGVAATSAGRAFSRAFSRARTAASMLRREPRDPRSGRQEQALRAPPGAPPAASGRRARAGPAAGPTPRTGPPSGRVNPHQPVPHLGPDEPFGMSLEPVAGHASPLQTPAHQHHPGPVPHRKPDPVRAFRAEHEDAPQDPDPSRTSPAPPVPARRCPCGSPHPRRRAHPCRRPQPLRKSTGRVATKTFTGPPRPDIRMPRPAPPGPPASDDPHRRPPPPGSRYHPRRSQGPIW